MGIYSVYGSDAFDARVDEDLCNILAHLCALPESELIQAVILMGGYGRGEGTPYLSDNSELPYNDYDLIVVSQDLTMGQSRLLWKRFHDLEEHLFKVRI